MIAKENMIVFNSQEKAERCIHTGMKTHKMHWRKNHDTFNDITKYIVWYVQK